MEIPGGLHSNLLVEFASSYEELKTFLTRKFGCPLLAEEVVQETWLRVQRLSPSLAVDHLRSEKVRMKTISGEPLPQDVANGMPLPDTVIEYQQRLAILRKAVDELPPRCREAFMLHKFKEHESCRDCETHGHISEYGGKAYHPCSLLL